MVLQVEGFKINYELDLPTLYSNFPNLAVNGSKFASIPCRSFNGSDAVLYIRQKEDVVTFHGDKFDDGNVVKRLGTQDVLTCHVVALRHEETGVTAFAHFDEYVRLQRLEAFLLKFHQVIMHRTYYGYEDEHPDDTWEWYSDEEEDEAEAEELDENIINKGVSLQLVGGLKEESGKGGVLSRRILTFFSTHHLTFRLDLVCLGPANTRIRGRPEPIVGGVLCDLTKSGKLFPATFNRSFVDGLPQEAVNSLMLGPSLLKKPERLKKMILEQEDKGFSFKVNSSIALI